MLRSAAELTGFGLMKYTPRPYQSRVIQEAREAIRDIRKRFPDRGPRILLVLPCGAGKCLGKGTPVLMADATIKPVEDVVIGDTLMGPDGNARTVISLARGREELYRVTPRKGDPYVVNGSHILSLRRLGNKSKKNPRAGEVVNISVRDYLKRSEDFRRTHTGWRAPANFGEVVTPIDPYFLGLWLGDGTHYNASITTGDKEIVDYLHEFARANGCQSKARYNSENSVVVSITKNSGYRNPIVGQLRAAGVLRNKHVPHFVKLMSRDDRIAFLSGFLDADGYLSNGGYDTVQKVESVSRDIAFIARSLGLAAYVSKCQKTCYNNGVSGTYWRVSISGDCSILRLVVPKRQATPRAINKNPLNVGIKVEPIGEGDYYGFEIDGDRLFMLGDFTVTHNTAVSGFISQAHIAARADARVAFLAHRDFLIDQTSATYADMGIDHSFAAQGRWFNPWTNAHLCMVQSMKSRLAKFKQAPTLFFTDECHHGVSATYRRVYDAWPHAVHIGLTATPERLDGKGLAEIYDEMIVGPSVEELIQLGALSDYILYAPTTPDMAGVRKSGGDYNRDQVEGVMDRPVIIGDMVKHYLRYARGKRAVYFLPSIRMSQNTAEAFRAAGVRAIHLDGDSSTWDRTQAARAMADNDMDVICNVDLFGEGYDLAAQAGKPVTIDAVGLGRPTLSLTLYTQQVMRCMRPAPGKKATILDHAGNMERHGFPDDDRECSLEGNAKSRSGAASVTKECENCFARIHNAATVCKHCGHICGADRGEGGGRPDIEQVDGELEQVDKDALKRQKKVEEWTARSLDDLIDLARRRGYRYPEKWAGHKWTARQAAARKKESADQQALAFYEQMRR